MTSCMISLCTWFVFAVGTDRVSCSLLLTTTGILTAACRVCLVLWYGVCSEGLTYWVNEGVCIVFSVWLSLCPFIDVHSNTDHLFMRKVAVAVSLYWLHTNCKRYKTNLLTVIHCNFPIEEPCDCNMNSLFFVTDITDNWNSFFQITNAPLILIVDCELIVFYW